VRALTALGVDPADSSLADGHSEYFGKSVHRFISPAVQEYFLALKPVNARPYLHHPLPLLLLLFLFNTRAGTSCSSRLA
jgi:hypothetical protein